MGRGREARRRRQSPALGNRRHGGRTNRPPFSIVGGEPHAAASPPDPHRIRRRRRALARPAHRCGAGRDRRRGRTTPTRPRRAQSGPVPRADDRQGAAGGRRRRDRDRAAPVRGHRRGYRRALRLHDRARLPRPQSDGGRAAGAGGGRRLWARHAGALLRHRSALPASVQGDRTRRERHRVHALCPVGPGLQSRPRLADGRRVHQACARRPHHPHGHPRGAAADRRRGPGRDAETPFPRRGDRRHRDRFRRRQAQASAT